MNNYYEEKLNKKELEDLQIKREKFFNDYIKNYRIYLICVRIISILIGYICTCYGEIFPNSYTYFDFYLVLL